MTTTAVATKRAGAACSVHGKVHSRPKARERAPQKTKIAGRQGNTCAWCGSAIVPNSPNESDWAEMDRIVPGGRYSSSNLIAACSPCNGARGNKSFSTFLAVCKRPDLALEAVALAKPASLEVCC